MKICFYCVTASLTLGGLETYIWELGRELSTRGHDVTVVTGSGGKSRLPAIRMVEFSFRPRNTFPRFPNLSPGFRSRYRKLCERLSFAQRSLPYLISSRFDVIVVVKPFDFPVLWWAKRKGLTASTVFSSGGEDFFAGDRLFRGSVDHWAACSRSNARQISARYRRAVREINYGVDTALFNPPAGQGTAWRHRYGIPAEAVLVVSVGRLVPWKGLQIVIEALKDMSNVHYAVVGDGSYKKHLQELTQAYGLQNKVHFVGPISHSDLPGAFSMADIFVQPSTGDEAFGITLTEAMACGLPVLGSNSGGIPEVIDPGRTGLIVPAGDVVAWRQAITRLIEDPSIRKRFGEAGRERVERKFTWSAAADQFEEMLREEI